MLHCGFYLHESFQQCQLSASFIRPISATLSLPPLSCAGQPVTYLLPAASIPPCEVLIGVDCSALHQWRQLRRFWQKLLLGATRAGRAVDPDPHDPPFDLPRAPVTRPYGHRYGTRIERSVKLSPTGLPFSQPGQALLRDWVVQPHDQRIVAAGQVGRQRQPILIGGGHARQPGIGRIGPLPRFLVTLRGRRAVRDR